MFGYYLTHPDIVTSPFLQSILMPNGEKTIPSDYGLFSQLFCIVLGVPLYLAMWLKWFCVLFGFTR